MAVLIIADDLSGAADCAIAFARTGHHTIVSLHAESSSLAGLDDHLAVDTDTRRAPARVAAQRTAAAFAALTSEKRRLYKKIDSTLRGNWAAEVADLVPLIGPAIVAPAYPAQGRTVRHGQVVVHGVPLERTETWQLEHAHGPAGIAAQLEAAGLRVAVLQNQAMDDPAALSERIEHLADRQADAIVIDSESTEALRRVALATLPMARPIFWVGSGGLAREIAALLPVAGCGGPDTVPRPTGPTLVLAGSLSSVTERQTARLVMESGIQVLVVPPSVLREGPAHAAWVSLQQRIEDTVRSGTDLLLKIARDERFDPGEGAQLAAAVARLAAPSFERIGGLVATGGETARAMLVESGVDHLLILDELEPGVILSAASGVGRASQPWVVTKAGAFGTEHALLRAWQALRPAPPDSNSRKLE